MAPAKIYFDSIDIASQWTSLSGFWLEQDYFVTSAQFYGETTSQLEKDKYFAALRDEGLAKALISSYAESYEPLGSG